MENRGFNSFSKSKQELKWELIGSGTPDQGTHRQGNTAETKEEC